MSQPLSCSQALLNEIVPATPTTWTEAFDKVVKDVLEQCRPGYVEIPTDAVQRKVSAEGLKVKLVGSSLGSPMSPLIQWCSLIHTLLLLPSRRPPLSLRLPVHKR